MVKFGVSYFLWSQQSHSLPLFFAFSCHLQKKVEHFEVFLLTFVAVFQGTAEVSLSCKHQRLYVYESAHILDRRPAVVKVNATLYPKSTPEGKVSRQDDEIFFL